MKIFGITNSIIAKCHELGIFMFDFDKLPIHEVREECNFLSNCFNLDIYLLSSSYNSWHIISFDIMSNKEISEIQNWVSLPSDYVNVDECVCDFYNILRLGKKGNKPSPLFVEAFLQKDDNRIKSLGHYSIYRKLCGIPEMTPDKIKYFVKTHVDLIQYNSNKTQRNLKTKFIGR